MRTMFAAMGARRRAGMMSAITARASVVGVAALIGAVTSCSSDGADASSTYTVVEERTTDLGVAAVVSVKADEAPADVIHEVFAEHQYASVTMVCEGSDLETDGWVLKGTVDDGELNAVVAHTDMVCR